MTEKKYLYALNESGFGYECYSTDIWGLMRIYPKLKVGDVISRAEICKPKLEDYISVWDLEDRMNERHEDETGCNEPIINIPRDRYGDIKKHIVELLKPFSRVEFGVYWKFPEDYVLTEKDLEDEQNT